LSLPKTGVHGSSILRRILRVGKDGVD